MTNVENHNNHVYNPGECLKWIIIQCNNLAQDGEWPVGTTREVAICRGCILNVEVNPCEATGKVACVEYDLDISGSIRLDDYRSIEEYCKSTKDDIYTDITPERWSNFVEV